ncbi:hypothetical protein CONCODRAFT_79257 [Conidiobolus coronatus NRRL 28638]|uniref:Uncharacterized protein n=1 Tax=Conidiobolus coronatus (strain ATCC 28846 / CBS 209.66 / NRRL 28638) TaxID=796925 RepID=A0A137P3A7_CONC2|nr:hypothetical protein CONCODRAFT_79257 [Conidiobolus coronatus NRRL 28638]|eukprot:KXN69516.1 hypothetical protein CONCODRAFT_79257 [Conidiobolus coronatus NRRL 28638]
METSNALILIICCVIGFGLVVPIAMCYLTSRKREEICDLENYYPQVGPVDVPVHGGEFLEPLPTYEEPPHYDAVIDAPAYDRNEGGIPLEATNSNIVVNTMETAEPPTAATTTAVTTAANQ